MTATAGIVQLKGCLQRIYIEKRRNLRITCCEFFSHLILIIILVLGYYQTSVINHNARIYNEIMISVPPVPGLNDLNDSVQVIHALTNGTQLLNLYNQVIEGPLFIPTLQQFLYVGNQFANNFDQLGS